MRASFGYVWPFDPRLLEPTQPPGLVRRLNAVEPVDGGFAEGLDHLVIAREHLRDALDHLSHAIASQAVASRGIEQTRAALDRISKRI